MDERTLLLVKFNFSKLVNYFTKRDLIMSEPIVTKSGFIVILNLSLALPPLPLNAKGRQCQTN